jgi:hypothetical protein
VTALRLDLVVAQAPADAPGLLVNRVRFGTANDEAPSSPPGTGPGERLSGESLMTPGPAARARLRYTCISDPAGAGPASLVHGPAKKATVDSSERSLEKRRRDAERAR